MTGSRLRAALATALLALAVALVPSPAQAQADVLAVGDSVMLGAKWALQQRGVAVNAKVSRQAWEGISLLRAKRSALPDAVVVHLGTNGTLPDTFCARLLRAVGPRPTIHLVTIKADRRWVAGNNRLLRRCAAGHADQVRIVDWAWAANRHPSWVYRDGIHLRPAGARAFARIIDEAVARG